MRASQKFIPFITCFLILSFSLFSQSKTSKKDAKSIVAEPKKPEDKYNSGAFSALKFRSIGPAVTSGRISDFAFNPLEFASTGASAIKGMFEKHNLFKS